VLSQITRAGLGGAIAGGRQYVSWIHGDDFVRACDFILAREDLAGAVNLASPEPLPHAAFMRALAAHRQLMVRVLAGEDAHPGQAICLRMLTERDGLSQRELAQVLHLSPPTEHR
jgi:nucleoside-diphosphate-sugar epimerase